MITDTLKIFDGTDLNVTLSAPSQIAILSVHIYCTSHIDTAFEFGLLLQHYFDDKFKRTTNLSLPEVDAFAQILVPGP